MATLGDVAYPPDSASCYHHLFLPYCTGACQPTVHSHLQEFRDFTFFSLSWTLVAQLEEETLAHTSYIFKRRDTYVQVRTISPVILQQALTQIRDHAQTPTSTPSLCWDFLMRAAFALRV
jgi:hypothetical protein